VSVDARRGLRFEYVGFDCEPEANRVVCRYRLVGPVAQASPDASATPDTTVTSWDFCEVITFPGGGDWSQPAVTQAARLLFLLTGVSYYKAGAPPVIDLGTTALTATELGFLREYYLEGLGEFGYRNNLDLSDLTIEAPTLVRTAPAGYQPSDGRPLVPFGGGVDSIVSVELIRKRADDVALFVVNRPGDQFAAIEEAVEVTGLPVVRAERSIDDQVLRSRELGFLNGHVPVTGIISAIAVLAAVLEGRDAVVLSNEWSASSATLEVAGRSINHQWSKSEAFEAGFRQLIAESIGERPDYFSLLRPLTEVWIAARFAESPQYLQHFRSCNRAFHIDQARRLDHWCGVCDKCCFIDLVLAPFVDEADLRRVFGEITEPLANPELAESFRRLLALTPDAKPWECVGDVAESRVAARLAAQRPDRKDNPILAALVDEAAAFADPTPDELMRPIGRHFVPERYAPDLFVV
jgi:UDP-N-acetyl-alpha-D-muramoyl-L-alanyl-L-glutamate epimerase